MSVLASCHIVRRVSRTTAIRGYVPFPNGENRSYPHPVRSWRESTPEPVQEDLDGIATAALSAAREMITKHGEFFPFGMTVGNEGEVGLAAADPGLGERAASLAVLSGLYDGAVGNRGTYRAVGFVADVRTNGGNAVRVEAEHRDGGPPLVILMPYQRKGLVTKTVTYGQMTVSEGMRRVWTGV